MHNIKYNYSSRPLNLPWLSCFFLAVILVIASVLARAGEIPQRSYENSFATVQKISAELHQALDASKRQQVFAEAVLLEKVAVPCLAPGSVNDGRSPANVVRVSAGLVEWINRVAHARALDEAGRESFQRCFTATVQGLDGKFAAVGETLAPEKAWDFDVMNHQAGLFNQMTGTLLAIDLAHHHLGHYKKYSAKLVPTNDCPAAIATVLTEKEWREAVMKGARHALDCGLGVDGLRAILEGFEKSPARPAWSAYFVHPKADLSKVSRDLEKMEKDFFLVEK